MIGSTCFALGSFPPFFLNISGRIVGVTFFVGSLFFTSAGTTQLMQVAGPKGARHWVRPGDSSWWAAAVQLVGMLFFNINTFRSAFVDIPTESVNRLIWAPDFLGSVAFLVASHIAWWMVCGRWLCVESRNPEWWMAALNYTGSAFFMLSALGDYTLPTTGEVANIALVNAGTFLGAICFFAAAYLLLPPRPGSRPT